MDKQLAALTNAIKAAEAAMVAHLVERFPAGAACGVMLNGRQRNPSPATILRHEANNKGGCIVVELDSHKPHSRYNMRFIKPENVRLYGKRTTT